MEQASKQLKLLCSDPDELDGVAGRILESAPGSRVFCIYGKMGAGKTTLIKALCRSLGVNDHVTSPTFTLVNEYQSKEHGQVYHFDFYRIKNVAEALDLGIENYLYSNNYCFLEWPEKIAPLLPEGHAVISIEVKDDVREITLSL